MGAKVILISGPTNEKINHLSSVELHSVITADHMYEVVKKYYAQSDIAIASAAVCDFRVESQFKSKIKSMH